MPNKLHQKILAFKDTLSIKNIKLILILILVSIIILIAIILNVPLFDGVPGDMLSFVRHNSFLMNWSTIIIGALLFLIAIYIYKLIDRKDKTQLYRRKFIFSFILLLLTGLSLQFQIQRVRTAGWLHWESQWKTGQMPVKGIAASGFRIVDNWWGGYLNDAYTIKNTSWLLKEYTSIINNFHIHPHNKPPGGVLLMRFLIVSLESLPFPLLKDSSDLLIKWFPDLKTSRYILAFEHKKYKEKYKWYPKLTNDQIKKRYIAYPIVIMSVVFIFSFLSVLTTIPLYLFTKKFLGSSKQALCVSFSWLCLPGLLILSPVIDQIYPLFAMTLLLLALLFQIKKSYIYYFFIIFGFAFSLLFTPLFILLIPVCSLLMANFNSVYRDFSTLFKLILRTIVISFVLLIGIIILFFTIYSFTHFNYMALFQKIYKTAGTGIDLTNLKFQFYTILRPIRIRFARPYLGALIFNQYELILSCGFIPYFLAIYQLFCETPKAWFHFKVDIFSLFTFTTIGVMFFLCISGRLHHEACRICLPFLPIVLIISIHYLFSKFENNYFLNHILISLGTLQLIWTMVIREFMIIN